MRVLVACEFSGIVRDAFRALGHDAMSADLLPSERPGPHYQGDVRDILGDGFGLLVAHPPCQYLSNSGVRWLYGGKGTTIDPTRWAAMERAAAFFAELLTAPVPRIAVENPVMHGHARRLILGHPDVRPDFVEQRIQPWQFGSPESKTTGLWLRGLPPLTPTDVLPLPPGGHWANQTPSGQNKLGPSPDRWRERSRTYPGVAAAMAAQWGNASWSEPDNLPRRKAHVGTGQDRITGQPDQLAFDF